jgi:hypothetical protein
VAGRQRNLADSEALLARLEERRDPVKLNAHCFWMMWQYSAMGRFADAVAMCDRGIELADLIGSAPVQYGSIKAIALTEAGRFDEVDAAIAQEVTDEAHPFGQAMASHARSVFLTRIGAWGPALESLTDTLTRAEQVSRVWMQYWAGSLMAVVAAHAGQRSELAVAVTEAPMFGEWHHGLTGAQVALAEGTSSEPSSWPRRRVPPTVRHRSPTTCGRCSWWPRRNSGSAITRPRSTPPIGGLGLAESMGSAR